jgi:hypothetical protein
LEPPIGRCRIGDTPFAILVIDGPCIDLEGPSEALVAIQLADQFDRVSPPKDQVLMIALLSHIPRVPALLKGGTSIRFIGRWKAPSHEL